MRRRIALVAMSLVAFVVVEARSPMPMLPLTPARVLAALGEQKEENA